MGTLLGSHSHSAPNNKNTIMVSNLGLSPTDSSSRSILFVAPIRLHLSTGVVETTALVDSGSAVNAIHPDVVKQHGLQPARKLRALQGYVVDGRKMKGTISQEILLTASMSNHYEQLVLDLVPISPYPVILGIKWLELHDPYIKWSARKLRFSSEFCHLSCLWTIEQDLPKSIAPISIEKAVTQPPNPGRSVLVLDSPMQSKASPPSVLVSKRPGWKRVRSRTRCKAEISVVSPRVFKKSLGKGGFIGAFLLRPAESPAVISSINTQASSEFDDDDLAPIPFRYHDLLEFFSESNANALPEIGTGNVHSIPLEPNTKPPYGRIYALSVTELETLRKYLSENLKNGFIRPSMSPAGAPVLFIRKKDGSLRLCVDYRGLNKITVKNRYPLPLIPELLDRLSRAKIYTKLDMRNAYHRCRIDPPDVWKTAFRTRYGHFEYVVMPFGLTNAPGTFQGLINDALRDLLDICCIAYLDDVLIYSDSEEQHEADVRRVIERLQKHGLFANASKCEFHVTKTSFLGYVIAPEGVSMDPCKVEAVTNWPVPTSVKELQQFLGFANYYRRFIWKYSLVVQPLTSLLKANVKFQWSSATQSAFDELKTAFTSAPILRHYDSSLPTRIECDASAYVASGALFQKHEDGLWHPVAFLSKKFDPTQQRWDNPDKELYAIVLSIRSWRHFLEGIEFEVYTDHQNLLSFMSSKLSTVARPAGTLILPIIILPCIISQGFPIPKQMH
jgi:hypothetical protein